MRLASKIFYLFSSDKELRLRLEHILGFRPGYLPYYQTALIHRSKIEDAEQNNERLEFLGDAILGALVAEYLFKKYCRQIIESCTNYLCGTLVGRKSSL